MKNIWLGNRWTGLLAGTVVPRPYASIATTLPLVGDFVYFEASYIRHREWHRQAKDTWSWYGYTISWGAWRRPSVVGSAFDVQLQRLRKV